MAPLTISCILSSLCLDDEEEVFFQEGLKDDLSAAVTLMLKNIPSRCPRNCVLETIDKLGFDGSYCFFYLPMKRNQCQNYGYAFISFMDSAVAQLFSDTMDGYRLKETSGKLLSVAPAELQGLPKNKNKTVAQSQAAAIDAMEPMYAEDRPAYVTNSSLECLFPKKPFPAADCRVPDLLLEARRQAWMLGPPPGLESCAVLGMGRQHQHLPHRSGHQHFLLQGGGLAQCF
eukprot:TRINITY_DN33161_c0_g1_i1.p1 TRINITY_DN33161_c0_g1~~TRINITY_DN33161_c0_g1_i1.p1  ORF type:complete len:230 (-),score=50.20 TRINITY_DN33161_c0_g1_i1:479-1168(-)